MKFRTQYLKLLKKSQDLLEYFGTSDYEEMNLCHGCRIDSILDYVKRKKVSVREFWDGGTLAVGMKTEILYVLPSENSRCFSVWCLNLSG